MISTLSVKEAAAQLGCSIWVVYDLFNSGDLPGFRVKSSIRVYADSVTGYIDRNKNRQASPPQVQVVKNERPKKRQKPTPGLNQKVSFVW